MVKSKARSHLIQYLCNKPTKWGFKLWAIADPSGYTLDFLGKEREDKQEHGLTYDVMKLIGPLCFQGYHHYIDNFYTSAKLLDDNLEFMALECLGVVIPLDVKMIKEFLGGWGILHGMGCPDESKAQHPAEQSRSYYLCRDDDEVLVESTRKPSPIVYMVWKDARAVCVKSPVFLGHTEGTVSRKKIDPKTGGIEQTDIDVPIVVQMYTKYMGGVCQYLTITFWEKW